MNLFRFRAECQKDVDDLRNLLVKESYIETEKDSVFPDVEAFMGTKYDVDEILEIMRHDEDWHVMRQTLTNWSKYTGERDHSID